MRCRICLLGGLRVEQAERIITRFRSQRTGSLLAYLALFRQRPHPREVLIELLWPECDPIRGRNNLSASLSSLRHQLEPPGIPSGAVITADRSTVGLNPAVVTTDVAEFETALDAAANSDTTAGRAQCLMEAVGLYRGPFLHGSYEEWVLVERGRLSERYLRVLQELSQLAEERGDLGHSIDLVQRAVAIDPLSEELHAELMRLYGAAGQPAAALRQYRKLERILQVELGLTPSPTIRQLAEELTASGRDLPSLPSSRWTVRGDSGPHEAVRPQRTPSTGRSLPVDEPEQRLQELPPRRAEAARADLLPLQITRFFGRECEIARLSELLLSENTRLITLTGPGGSGKTRLALEVARQVVPSLGGAVCFVPLADLTDTGRIIDTVRDALRLAPSPHLSPMEQIEEHLSSQRSLLVLDNFEHLVEHGAALVTTLLGRIRSLTCLVTSRQRLDLAGECEFPVGPLPAPIGEATPEQLIQNESVQLFLDRAQAVRPDFQVTRANAAAVAELCRRLEGIPLALELAAARAQVLTPAQMLRQLEHRLDFLVSRRRDTLTRHRTLRAAIDWGYQLLSPELQRFFARLTVFKGGWSLEAAELVCEEPLALDYLAQLRECSLILTEEASHEFRFRMLETLWEFAAEQLEPEERAWLQRRHAEWYLDLAEREWPEDAAKLEWLDRLQVEHDNFRAALDWALGNDSPLALRMATALGGFWAARGPSNEGYAVLCQALAQEAAAPSELCAQTYAWAANLADDFAAKKAWLERALALARERGDRRGIAVTLRTLGQVEWAQGSPAEIRDPPIDESLCIWREIGDRKELAFTLFMRGVHAESLELYRQEGDQWGVAYVLKDMGLVAMERGDLVAARPFLEESLAIFQHFGDPATLTLIALGLLALRQGNCEEACARLLASLATCRPTGIKRAIVECLEGLAEVMAETGEPVKAARWFGAADALREAISFSALRDRHEGARASVRRTLGEASFAAAWAAGRSLTWQQAADEALADGAGASSAS